VSRIAWAPANFQNTHFEGDRKMLATVECVDKAQVISLFPLQSFLLLRIAVHVPEL